MSVVSWREHIFIEARDVDKADAEAAKISVKLMDKGLLKNELIGEFNFDMSYIYFMKDHVMLHKWLALSDPGGADFSKIAAYLKVSISVSSVGDTQVEIKDDDDEADNTDVMMSPALHPEFF